MKAWLLVALAPMACTSILDIDSLNSEPRSDTEQPDLRGEGGPDLLVLTDLLPGDLGSCVQGAPCTVPGAKGECAVGEAECTSTSEGTCKQTVQPSTELCNAKDDDCDGTNDFSDKDAHDWCKQLNPVYDTCAPNGCQCGTVPHCHNGNICVAGACVCGTGPPCVLGHSCVNNKICLCGTNPPCAQPNPRCSAGTCVCAGTIVCQPTQTCNTSIGKCEGGPDLGIDQGPKDQGVDQAPPDQGAPDVALDQSQSQD